MEVPIKSTHIFAKHTPITLKAVILVVGVIGQLYTAQSMNFMSGAHFMFFTNLSNVWIMAITAVFMIYDILGIKKSAKPPAPPNWLYAIKFICTVAIALTFLVFSVLLIPQLIASGHSAYIFSISNLCVHNVVPMLAILDFALFDYKYETKKGTFVLGIILPLAYVAFVMACSVKGIMFGAQRFPYFFLDYYDNGWFGIRDGKIGVAYWIVALSVLVLLIGFALIALKKAVAKRKKA